MSENKVIVLCALVEAMNNNELRTAATHDAMFFIKKMMEVKKVRQRILSENNLKIVMLPC